MRLRLSQIPARPAVWPALARRPFPSFAFLRLILPVAAVLAVHAALRMTYAGGVESDDADLVLFSQAPAWGYSEQPPLYSWLCQPVFRLVGVGAFALTVVRTGLLAAGCVLLYLNARLLCGDRRRALGATYAVLLVPSLAWNGLTYLTHTNLLVVTCLATLYAFLRLARDGRTRDYLLFGMACGAGVLSKYNFVWFAAALLAAAAAGADTRRRLFHPRILLSAGACALVVAPHVLWAYDHRALLQWAIKIKTVRYETLLDPYPARVLRGFREAGLAALTVFGPLLAAFALFFGRAVRAGHDPDPGRAAARRLLGRFFVCALLVVAGQILVLSVSRFHERWFQPFAAVLPLWLFARLDPAAVRPARAWAFRVLLVTLAVGYTALRVAQVGGPAGTGYGPHPLRASFGELARQIAAEAGPRPTILTPEAEVGGNLLLRLPGARVCPTLANLYPIPPGNGPVVLAWDAARGPQPPWLLFGRFADEYGRMTIPPGRVGTVTVAAGRPGGTPAAVAFTVLPAAHK
jgi:4-amino-4-deoxy-L-arabinose transferase-like glycosyltransferase